MGTNKNYHKKLILSSAYGTKSVTYDETGNTIRTPKDNTQIIGKTIDIVAQGTGGISMVKKNREKK